VTISYRLSSGVAFMKNHLPIIVIFPLIIIFFSDCMSQSQAQQSQVGRSTPLVTQRRFVGTITVAEPVTPAPATCQTTPIYRGGTNQSGLADIPWVQAKPSSSGIKGYLFFAGTGASSNYRFLHTGSRYPDGSTTKVLWEITNPQASDTIEVVGRKLSGGSEVFRQSFPGAASPAGDYPSIVNVPTAGCWRLDLKSGTVTASVVFWVVGN